MDSEWYSFDDQEWHECYSKTEQDFYFMGKETGDTVWANYPDPPPMSAENITMYGAPPDKGEWAYWEPEGGPPAWFKPGGREQQQGGNEEQVEAGEDEDEFTTISSVKSSRCPSVTASIDGCIPAVREISARDMRDPVREFLQSLQPPRRVEEEEEPPQPPKTRRWGRWLIGGLVAGVLLKMGGKLVR